ncbi:hypothetical protein [Motiliproteus sp.]|uniref:hypothetical protein n=1 Tax=Motiliproteus sp. TaxID=1898955 RepID=UPI003BACC448
MRQGFLVSVLMLGWLTASSVHGEEVWKIASLNWEPYSSARMTTQGNAIQKLRTLLKQQNITLQVDFYPWARAKRIAQEAEYVGYFPAWPEEVGDGFVASPVIDWSWIAVLKQAGRDVNFQQLDQLFESYKVGLVSTYVCPDAITRSALSSSGNVVYAPNEASLLKMLVAGRQDCAVTDPNVMMYLSERDGIGQIETVRTLFKKELVLAMRASADNQHRIERLKSLLQDPAL